MTLLASALLGLYLAGRVEHRPGTVAVRVTRLTGSVARLPDTRLWQLPLLFQTKVVPLRWTQNLGAGRPLEVTSREGLRLRLDVSLRLHLKPEELLPLVRKHGLDFKASLVAPAVENVLRQLAADNSATKFYFLDSRPRMEQQAAETVWNLLAPFGIVLDSLRLVRVDADRDARISMESHRAAVSRRRVWLIGWDGADWNYLRPLLKKGRMPNLQRLIRNGTSGPVRTIRPVLSPLIWTTIATGRKPLVHGILDFVAVDSTTGEMAPATRNMRRVQALWNIVSLHGKSAGVLGWLVTWPAEQVNGWLVTDRVFSLFPDSMTQGVRPDSALVFPALLQAEVDSLVDDSGVPGGIKPVNRVTQRIWKENQFRRRVALHLLRRDPPDFAALYFDGIDRLGHRLLGRAEIEPARARRQIEAMYVFLDGVLGQILSLADQQTTIMLVSDHGFFTPEHGPSLSAEVGEGHAAEWHRDRGILVVKGPGIRHGMRLRSAHVLDIAPTVLALLDLPVPADFSGRVLAEVMEPAYLASHPVDRITSYEPELLGREKGQPQPLRSAADPRIRQRLESLGYLNPESANAYNNLGLLYRQEGAYDEAVRAFKKAIELAPDVAAFYDNLGVAYSARGDYAAAVSAHQRALSLDPTSAKACNNLGNAYLERGEEEKAMAAFEKAISLAPNFADAYANLASVYYNRGDFSRARSLLQKSLALDPDNLRARYNLGVMYGERGRSEAAIREFQAVLESGPGEIMAARTHNALGVAYFRRREYSFAAAEFQEAIRRKPDMEGVHGRLGLAYLAMNDIARAKAEFRRELALHPKNRQIAQALQALERRVP